MTKEQIKYIVEDLLDDAVDTMTPLSKCAYITLTKQENQFIRLKDKHVYFDTTNEILRVYPVRKVSSIPNHSNYIEVNGSYYEYLNDADGLAGCDYYPFDQIIIFKPLIEK